MSIVNRIHNFFNSNSHKNPLPIAQKEFQSDLERIPTSLEEKQELLAHYVRMVARDGISMGAFFIGAAGLGKSKTISETLAQEGIIPVLINSHITPLSLYETLFFNRKGKVIWLDDCDSIFSNLKILGILRSALWGINGTRTVTYNSTRMPDHLPTGSSSKAE